MSTGSGVTPAGVAPSRAAKIGLLSGGMPAPVNMPLPSDPTITVGCSGSRAPRPALVCAAAAKMLANAAVPTAAASAIDTSAEAEIGRARALLVFLFKLSPYSPAEIIAVHAAGRGGRRAISRGPQNEY